MKLVKYLLVALAAITTGYLVMLGCFNTLVADDFGFICRVEKLGIWKFIYHAYMTWQCRFSSYLVTGIVYDLFGRSTNLVGYTIIMLVLGYLTFYRLFRDVMPKMSKGWVVLFSIIVNNLAVMSFFEMNTFYWLCTPDYYLLMYATIILLDILFLSSIRTSYKWIVLLLCALYICGNSELYLAILIFFTGIALCAWIIKLPTKITMQNQRFQMLVACLLIFGIGFLVQYFGPGTQIRMEAWQSDTDAVDFIHNFSLLPFVKASFKALALLFLRLFFQGHYYLVALALFLFIGHIAKDHFICNKNDFVIRIKYVICGFVIFYVVSVEISVFSLGCLAPIRSYTFIHYLFLMCIGYIGILIGANKMSFKTTKNICLAASTFLVIFTLCFAYVEYPIVKRYKQNVIATFREIQNKGCNLDESEPIIVEPFVIDYIPNAYSYFRNMAKKKLSSEGKIDDEMPGFFPYLPFELSKKPNDFKNKGLKEYLNLNNDIIGWVEPLY